MHVRVKFAGGPLDGQSAQTNGLSEVRVFFPPSERRVIAYWRADELLYAYDHDMSMKLTAIYDEAKAHFAAKTPSHLMFDDAPFSDEPITENE